MSTVAPRGSPVAFYRRLPATGEPELIDGLLGPGASILDLGCAAGRIAGPLAALGHPVTGVDRDAAMIEALPPTVEGVVGDATTISLGRRFDAVLLASHLVNDPEAGAAFARTAATHVAADGVVIGQTYPPGSDPTAGVGATTRLGDAEVTLLRATRAGDVLRAEVRYGVDGLSWTESFSARIVDEAGLIGLLAGAGLAFDRWLALPGWFIARLAAGPSASRTAPDRDR